MNKEELAQMYQKANGWNPLGYVITMGELERFAVLVASAERERILDICKEGLWDAEGIRYHLDNQDRGQA